MSSNIVNQMPYLRTTRAFPEDIHLLSVQLNKSYVDIATAVNNRTIGLFPTTRPAITGESWFIAANQKQQTLRQVYTFAAIASGTELDVPTNISSFTQFTRIYGTVVTNVVDYRPLPYVDPITLTNGMALLVGTVGGVQQIRIILGATAPAVTSGIVVLEWLSSV